MLLFLFPLFYFFSTSSASARGLDSASYFWYLYEKILNVKIIHQRQVNREEKNQPVDQSPFSQYKPRHVNKGFNISWNSHRHAPNHAVNPSSLARGYNLRFVSIYSLVFTNLLFPDRYLLHPYDCLLTSVAFVVLCRVCCLWVTGVWKDKRTCLDSQVGLSVTEMNGLAKYLGQIRYYARFLTWHLIFHFFRL